MMMNLWFFTGLSMENSKVNTAFVLDNVGCENRCVFCGNHTRKNIDENIEREFEKITRICRKNDVAQVEVSGNDPVEYEELPKIVEKITDICGCDGVAISTHGMDLEDESFLNELVESGADYFRIPLYGHNVEVHDSVTLNEGSFVRLMKAFKNLRELKNGSEVPGLLVTSLILKDNQDHLEQLFHFMSKLDFVDEFRIGLAGYDPENKDFVPHIPDFGKLEKDLPELLSYAESIGLDEKLSLADIPMCLRNYKWGKIGDFIPPEGGYEHFGIIGKDAPIYMQKIKTSDCRSCKHNKNCPGFLRTYVENGYFTPKPVKDEE